MALEFITTVIHSYPVSSAIFFGLVITLLSMLVTKYFTDQARMRELKEVQKACQLQLKQNKNNPQKAAELQKKMMACSMEMMKFSFKPMLITFIPVIVLIAFLRNSFVGTPLASSWIWYYIVTSLIVSFPLRKILKLA